MNTELNLKRCLRWSQLSWIACSFIWKLFWNWYCGEEFNVVQLSKLSYYTSISL